MPLFGTSESNFDASQNIQLISLNQRLATIEAYNVGNRLGVLEAVNSAARLSALESLGVGSRLTVLEALPTPTLASLGGEPIGAETRAKAYTDQQVAALPPAPTLASLGAEPAGTAAAAIASHKAEAEPHPQYVVEAQLNSHTSSVNNPHQVTLTQVGGEPAGAETRSKTYTDQQVAALLNNISPKSFFHIWGNTNKTSNGKSWQIINSSSYELGRAAQFTTQSLNDYAEFEQLLKAGSYELTLCFNKNNTGGITTIYCNNAQIGQVDLYNSTTQNNQRYTTTFTISTFGLQTFKIQVTGKNASSNGYLMQISNIQCRSTDLSLIQTVRINCGYNQDYTATDGNIWKADYGFTGGNAFNTEQTLGETFTVANTTNQTIYKNERSLEGGQSFTYDLYVGQTGLFSVKLLFCEAYYTAVGQRVGTIKLNGNNLLTNFDILAEAARRTALVKAWNNVSLSGNIQFSFTNMLINGIEIIRSS